jgi:hypothetical protein
LEQTSEEQVELEGMAKTLFKRAVFWALGEPANVLVLIQQNLKEYIMFGFYK